MMKIYRKVPPASSFTPEDNQTVLELVVGDATKTKIITKINARINTGDVVYVKIKAGVVKDAVGNENLAVTTSQFTVP